MNPNLVVKNKLKKMTAKEKEIYLAIAAARAIADSIDTEIVLPNM